MYTFADDGIAPGPTESDNPFGVSTGLVSLGEYATGWHAPDPSQVPPAVSGEPGNGAWDLGQGPLGAIRVAVPIGEAAADDNFISYEVRLQVNTVGYTGITVLPSNSVDGYSLADVGETDSAAFDDPYLGQWENRTWTARIEGVGEDNVTLIIEADLDDGSLIDTIEIYALAVAQREIREADVVIEEVLQTYDGSPKTVSVSTVPDGLDFVLSYDGREEPPVDAGSYEVIATVTEDWYVGAATNTLVIEPAALTVTGKFTALDKPYDGTTAASIGTDELSLVGVAAGDEGNVVLEPRAVFASSEVGTHVVSLAATSELTGASGNNYTLSLDGAPTASASIMPPPGTGVATRIEIVFLPNARCGVLALLAGF